MTLSACFDRLEEPTRTVTVYAPPPRPEIADRFETVVGIDAVDYRSLPDATAPEQGFLVVREDDEFVAAIALEAVREFLDPPLYDPWAGALGNATYPRVVDVFTATTWSALDRRQLLAVSREIECRAWRIGSGTLRAGFQRAEALAAAIPVYERLAAETALEVHVYIADDWERPSIPGVTVHADAGDEIGSHWALSYDGDGDPLWTSGLLARERDPGAFDGFWADDARLVASLERALVESAADEP